MKKPLDVSQRNVSFGKPVTFIAKQATLAITQKKLVTAGSIENKKEAKNLLSKCCGGCPGKFVDCGRRFQLVEKGEFVYCPTGERHLVD